MERPETSQTDERNQGPESKSSSLPPGSPTEPQAQTQATSARSLAGKRVVVCEDEGITQMQLRRILTQAGLKVVGVAGDGQTGVDVVLREHPDLVLMDIKMPVMDGLEAARQIMVSCDVCIIMLTAYATEEYQQQATALGSCGYIVKPVTAQTLLPQIQDAYAVFIDKQH